MTQIIVSTVETRFAFSEAELERVQAEAAAQGLVALASARDGFFSVKVVKPTATW